MNSTVKITLDDLELCVRTKTALRELGIKDVESLLCLTPGALLKHRGIGKFIINDIRKKLGFHGLALCGDILIMSASSTTLIHEIPEMLKKIQDQLNDLRGQIYDIMNVIDQITIRDSK